MLYFLICTDQLPFALVIGTSLVCSIKFRGSAVVAGGMGGKQLHFRSINKK